MHLRKHSVSRVVLGGLFIAVLALVVLVSKDSLTPSADVPAPTAPAKLTAQVVNKAVNLSWPSVKANHKLFYHVYRSSTESGSYKRLNDNNDEALSYVDSAVKPGQTYYYKVTAARKHNGSYINSAPASATVVVPGDSGGAVPPAPTSSSITPPTRTNHLYVKANGSDLATCMVDFPCRQITRALAVAVPDTLIEVGAGDYNGFKMTAKSHLTIQTTEGAKLTRTTSDTVQISLSSDIALDGFTVPDSALYGIRALDSDHIYILNNIATNCYYTCILTARTDDLVIANNQTSGANLQHGIYVSDSSHRITISGNQSYNNHFAGIQINAEKTYADKGDGITRQALIENNVIHDNGIMMKDGKYDGGNGLSLLDVQDSIVRNNLLYNIYGTGIANAQSDPPQLAPEGPRGMQIYNNTVVMAADGRYALQVYKAMPISKTTDYNVIRNNILFTANTQRGVLDYGDTTDIARVDSDYNVFGGTASITPDGWNTRIDLKTWQAQNHELHSASVAKLEDLFVDPAHGNYELLPGAIARDKGVTMPIKTDIKGKSRPAGGAYDDGAYEVQ